MSSTALIQSPSSKSHTISTTPATAPAAQRPTPSKIAATATSVLPRLSLTPRRTPQTPAPASSPDSVSTPGRWQHPRMQEVLRRRDRTRFDQSNVRVIGANLGLIIVCFTLPGYIVAQLPREARQATRPYLNYLIYALALFFLSNIAVALLPLYRTPDPCEDIALTPSQRHLLGLPPSTRAATPRDQDHYFTPPRYPRGATPGSSSSSLNLSGRESPANGRGSPMDVSLRLSGGVGGSPYSPSPLKEKMLRGGVEKRRSSFGAAGSPFNASDFDPSITKFDTPTKKTGLGMPNKWLYERGRGSPGATRNVIL